jgi:hypothetical protein
MKPRSPISGIRIGAFSNIERNATRSALQLISKALIARPNP